jgi:small-conductance mechanosensitive channel
MQNTTEIHNLLLDFVFDIERTSMAWQILVVLVSLGLAWWFDGILRKRISGTSDTWKFGIGGINRVAFPLSALLFVVIGKSILGHWYSVKLLNLAIPLLLSLALVRAALYLLRKLFAPSGVLQTWERVVSTVIWVGLALHISGFLPDIMGILDDLSFSVGQQRISLLLLMQGAISVAFTLLFALWLGRILQDRVMSAQTLDMNLRVVIAKIIRAGLLLLAILIALPLVGIDITVLSVFGGALGVGLGFGLQKIASNYVSGFIILLDKSVHLDDVITVADRYGTVSKLTARYMVLRGMDGTESIIPNETLITSTVINHSYSDRKVRVRIPVQVSYQSDLEAAMQIMLDAARHQSRVIPDPEPRVFLKEFADSGINLEMSIWIVDPEEGQASLRSEINLEIWRAFKQQGIEIPYPQRDIRIISQP